MSAWPPNNELALIVGIVAVGITAIFATALANDPIVVAAIGVIVLQIGVGLLNYLKTEHAEIRLSHNQDQLGRDIADNTAKTIENAAVANGMKDLLVSAARKEGLVEGAAAAAKALAAAKIKDVEQ